MWWLNFVLLQSYNQGNPLKKLRLSNRACDYIFYNILPQKFFFSSESGCKFVLFRFCKGRIFCKLWCQNFNINVLCLFSYKIIFIFQGTISVEENHSRIFSKTRRKIVSDNEVLKLGRWMLTTCPNRRDPIEHYIQLPGRPFWLDIFYCFG